MIDRAGIAAVCVAVSLWPQLVLAQGHRGAPPGQLKKPASSNTPAEAPDVAVVPTDSPRVRSFGMWLDDATLAAARSVWLTTGVTRWSSPVASGTELPSVNAAVGLTPRMQASFSVSHSRAWLSGLGDEVTSGVGNTYAGVKLLLVDRTYHDIGISAAPTLEILSTGSTADGSSRVNMILPVSFELGRGATRAYGSAGYFTRGATFASVAIERHLSPVVAVTGAIMQSWSTADADDAAVYGLSRRRTDIAGGVTAFVSPRVGVYASIGRTISAMDFDSARYVFATGVAVGFQVPPGILPRPPK